MCDNSSIENILNMSELLSRNISSDDSNDCVSSTSQTQNENPTKNKKKSLRDVQLHSILKKLNISEKELFLRLKKRNTTKGKTKKKLSIVSTKLIGNLHRKAQKKMRRKSERNDEDDDSDVDVLSDFSEDEVMSEESTSAINNCDIIESCQDVNNSFKDVNNSLSDNRGSDGPIRPDTMDKNSEDVTSSVDAVNDDKSSDLRVNEVNISDEILKTINDNIQKIFSDDTSDETKDSTYENVSDTTENSTNDLSLVDEQVTVFDDSKIESSITKPDNSRVDHVEPNTIDESHDDSVEIIEEFNLIPEKTTEQILQEINNEIFNLENNKIAPENNKEPEESIVVEDDDDLKFVAFVDAEKFKENLKAVTSNEIENDLNYKAFETDIKKTTSEENFDSKIEDNLEIKIEDSNPISSKNSFECIAIVDLTEDSVDQTEDSNNQRIQSEELDSELKLPEGVACTENDSYKELNCKLLEAINDIKDVSIELQDDVIQESKDAGDEREVQEIDDNELQEEQNHVIEDDVNLEVQEVKDVNPDVQDVNDGLDLQEVSDDLQIQENNNSDIKKDIQSEEIDLEIQEVNDSDENVEILKETKDDVSLEAQEEKADVDEIVGLGEETKNDTEEETKDADMCIEIIKEEENVEIIEEIKDENVEKDEFVETPLEHDVSHKPSIDHENIRIREEINESHVKKEDEINNILETKIEDEKIEITGCDKNEDVCEENEIKNVRNDENIENDPEKIIDKSVDHEEIEDDGKTVEKIKIQNKNGDETVEIKDDDENKTSNDGSKLVSEEIEFIEGEEDFNLKLSEDFEESKIDVDLEEAKNDDLIILQDDDGDLKRSKDADASIGSKDDALRGSRDDDSKEDQASIISNEDDASRGSKDDPKQSEDTSRRSKDDGSRGSRDDEDEDFNLKLTEDLEESKIDVDLEEAKNDDLILLQGDDGDLKRSEDADASRGSGDDSNGSKDDQASIISNKDDVLRATKDDPEKSEDALRSKDEAVRISDEDALRGLEDDDCKRSKDDDASRMSEHSEASKGSDDAFRISNEEDALSGLKIDEASSRSEDEDATKSLDDDLKLSVNAYESKSSAIDLDSELSVNDHESKSLEIDRDLELSAVEQESKSSVNDSQSLEMIHDSKLSENDQESKSSDDHESKPSEIDKELKPSEIDLDLKSSNETKSPKIIDSKSSEPSNSLPNNEVKNNRTSIENVTNELNKFSDETKIEKFETNNNDDGSKLEKLRKTELKSPQQEPSENSGSNTSSPPVATIAPLEFHTDDDIRDKIKQQLELLRCMKKPTKTSETERRRKSGSVEKSEENERNDKDASEDERFDGNEEDKSTTKKIRMNIRKSKDDENSWTIEKNPNESDVKNKNQLICVDIKKLIEDGSNKTNGCADLNDVLLSNEGDHLIVSVVGGYKSDDDKPASDVENNETITEYKQSDGSNFSITETLLKRDLSYKRMNDDINAIKPTKTNDITKIKGWRTKTFTIPSDLNDSKSDSDNEITIEEHPLVDPGVTRSVIKDYIDITQPGTSKDVVEEDARTEKNEKPNKNSVFVSDMLDDFLTNDSELKISYEIPKLVAEEGVSKPTSEIIEPVIPEIRDTRQNVQKLITRTNEPTFKPKTVAEKRKLLEMERKSKLVNTMEQNENTYLKQLEKEDIRNSVVKNIRNNMIKENVPFTKRCWSLANRNEQDGCQHVVTDGKRIKISGSTGGDDVVLTASIRRIIRKDSQKTENNKKTKPLSSRIEYRPGPLSKKHKLIKSTYLINHEYEVKKMPRIKLVIFAKQGKKVPLLAEQYLQICKDETGKISDEWAKFAASAVVSKNLPGSKKVTKVEFEIPYANRQNKILLRRIVTKAAKVKPVVKYPLVHVEDEIKDIVSSMLDTIDNQSLDVIKDDPDSRRLCKDDRLDVYKSDVSRSSSPADSMSQTIIKRRNTRKSKTTLELRRLNVQVIEVDVEDDVLEERKEVCKKSFCRLGCVCKSLSGVGSTMPDHCGREACMFQCTCTVNMSQQNHHSVTLPPGTDLLSTSTMVRLQDEAVKHLAKEEKKFTQTVIKANNQTIVVGSGTRERQKRVTKLPKKYTDFVNTTDDLLSPTESPNLITEQPEQNAQNINRKTVPIWNSLKIKPKKKTQQTPSGWYVKLERIDVPNVLPWCMVHSLYKCYCGGKGDDVKPDVTIKKTDDDNYINKKPVQRPQVLQKPQSTIKKVSVLQKGPQISIQKIPVETEELCARTRLLNSNYRSLKIKRVKEDDQAIDDKKIFELNPTNDIIIKRSRKSEPEQKIIINPYQTRTATKTKSDDSMKERVKIASLIDYTRSYMGLIIPTSSWVEKFQKMLNLLNANVRHIRLLQWNCMIERYKTNQLQLWWNNVSVKTRNNVVFTENKKRPSICHMNIKLFERTKLENFKIPEIVRSILGNKLPGTASKPEETYVILVYYDTDWEARGTIVLNNTSEQCKSQLSHKSLPKTILNIDYDSEYPKDVCYITAVKNKRPDNNESQQSVLINKNISQYATLQPTKRKAPPLPDQTQKLSKIDNVHLTLDRNKIKRILLSYLPNDTQIARWFVLKLENDFSVLKISATQFHIKYSHLMTAIQMANKNKKTVRIRSHSKVADINDTNKFGLYAIPGCNDKIFFGPYGPYEDHGLETYRYLNGKLYNTRTYNMMMGNPERLTSGFWLSNAMLQSGAEPLTQNITDTISKPKVEFVDLTENDSDDEDKNTVLQNQTDPLYSLLTADFSKNLSDVTIQRKTEEENPSEYIDVGNTIKTIHLPLKRSDLKSLERTKRPLETKEIEVINLDDDDGGSVAKKLKLNVVKKEKRQIPQLYPINAIKNIDQKSIGYIEVLKCDDQYSIPVVNDSKYKKKFKDLESTIIWLDKILKIKIFHFPSDLSLSLSVSEKQPVDVPKFNEDYLNGCHLVCEHGVFDLLSVTKETIKNMGYERKQVLDVLKLKNTAFVKRKIQLLGNCVGLDAAQVADTKIIDAAAQYIKKIENEGERINIDKDTLISTQKELLTKISFLLSGIPSAQYKHGVSKKIKTLLKKTRRDDGNKLIEAQKLPAGTSLKIINGSIVNVNSSQSILKDQPATSNRTTKKTPNSVLLPKTKKKPTTKSDAAMKLKLKLVNGFCPVPVPKLKEVIQEVDKLTTR